MADGRFCYASGGEVITPVTRASRTLSGYAVVNDQGQFTLYRKPLRTVKPGRFTVLVLGYGRLMSSEAK